MASQSYSIFFPTVARFIPCTCIAICYIKIFLFVRQKSANRHKDDKKTTDRMSKSLKIAKSLFASFSLFVVCWVPYGLVVATGFEDKYPIAIHATVTFLAHVNSTMNPVFYMIFNPAFRMGFKKLSTTKTGDAAHSMHHHDDY